MSELCYLGEREEGRRRRWGIFGVLGLMFVVNPGVHCRVSTVVLGLSLGEPCQRKCRRSWQRSLTTKYTTMNKQVFQRKLANHINNRTTAKSQPGRAYSPRGQHSLSLFSLELKE
jgi:hypothetical protein